MARVTKRTDRRGWWVRWTEHGKPRWKKARTKREAERQKRKIEGDTFRREELGIETNRRELAMAPIEEHVTAFEIHVRNGGATNRYVNQSLGRLRRALKAMRINRIGDLNRSGAETFLFDLEQGRIDERRQVSPKTRDDYAAVLKQFTAWAVDEDENRLARDPFRTLRRVVTRRTREALATFERRALTAKELERLIAAAPARSVANYRRSHPGAKPETLEGYRRKGHERGIVYAFAAGTGMRHTAIRSLLWGDLRLDGTRPAVRGAARYQKNKRTVWVPVANWLVESLREWRRTKSSWVGRPLGARDPLFPDMPAHIERRLREDAEYARIELADRERLDFHSLRTTCASLLVEHDVHPKKAQKILGHSTIAQTMEVYTRLRGDASHEAVNSVPGPMAGLQSLTDSGSPGVPLCAPKHGQTRSASDNPERKVADGTC